MAAPTFTHLILQHAQDNFQEDLEEEQHNKLITKSHPSVPGDHPSPANEQSPNLQLGVPRWIIGTGTVRDVVQF